MLCSFFCHCCKQLLSLELADFNWLYFELYILIVSIDYYDIDYHHHDYSYYDDIVMLTIIIMITVGYHNQLIKTHSALNTDQQIIFVNFVV